LTPSLSKAEQFARILYGPGMRLIVPILLLVIAAAGVACEGSQTDDTREKDGSKKSEIFVDPEATYDFPLAHLNAHRAGADPIRVEAVMRDCKLVAIEIGDA